MSDQETRREFLLLWTRDPEGEAHRPDDPGFEEWLETGAATGTLARGKSVAQPGEARSIVRRGDDVIVTDGPFPEFKEWFYGYSVILAPDLESAVEFASRHPAVRAGRGYVLPTLDVY